ncbi:unannotated protein [freshwater metagenome]|uniref:Unannotated protein n=1 Tax=freshwater metagenome TaxID=449393 RepID=A0A6J6M8T6_9ZZZZ
MSVRRERSAPTDARKTSRNRAISASPRTRGLRPRDSAPSTAISARPVSRSHNASTSSSTASSESGIPPAATTRSSAERVSRAEPAPTRNTYARPSGESSRPASATTWSTRPSRSAAESKCTSKCCVRLRMVGSTFCGSVVANTKMTCDGGSSSVFSNAFDAAVESMWTSSRMYTL